MYSRQTETIDKLTKEVQRLRSELTEANARLGDSTDSITIGFDDWSIDLFDNVTHNNIINFIVSVLQILDMSIIPF